MSQTVRLTCPECESGLRVPDVDDDTLVTCPRCGAEFTQSASAPPPSAKKPPAEEAADDGEEEDSPRGPKGKRSPQKSTDSNQTLLIGAIIALAVLASVAAIVVPLMMKSKGDNPEASAKVEPLPIPRPPGPPDPGPPGPPAPTPPAPPPGPAVTPPAPGTKPSPETPPNGKGAPQPAGEEKKGGPRMPKGGPANAGPMPPNGNPNRPNVNPEPPKPALDLDQGKARIAGSWETVIANPRNKKAKPTEITLLFSQDGKYSSMMVGNGSQQVAGYWEMVVKDDSYLVTVATSPVKDGKPLGVKTVTFFRIQFNGNDTMFLATQDGGSQIFARKK